MLDVLKTLIDGILEKAKTFKGDWNENDTVSPNYIKNRTHWTEKKEEIIYVFNNYSFESADVGGLYGINGEYNCETDPKINQTYTVIFDGEEYKCKCRGNEFSMDEGTTSEELIPCIIGNLGIIGAGADTGEPFMILFQKADNGINFITNTIGLHTISIYKNDIVEKVHKLDKKYLPDLSQYVNKDEVYSKEESDEKYLIQADWSTTNESDPSYILNKPTIYSDSVRYGNVQTLSDNQKARARANIGAAEDVHSDWLINNETKPEYIKNRIAHYGTSNKLINVITMPNNLKTGSDDVYFRKYSEASSFTSIFTNSNMISIQMNDEEPLFLKRDVIQYQLFVDHIEDLACFGNKSLFSDEYEDTGEFILIVYPDSNGEVGGVYTKEAYSGTVQPEMYKYQLNDMKQLDEIFIPDTIARKDYVESLVKKLNATLALSFYCIEDVTVITNGISKVYPANSNVEIVFSDEDVFEIIPTSNNSILSLTAYPGTLGTFYPWLEGVAQFSNILFDMNDEAMYSKWSQGNQGVYHVQKAQYTDCIFWSDNPYISDVSKRTNYTLTHTTQLPLCYSTIPDNTFKAFYLAFGVNSDPNWGNQAYRDSFAKATWATQVFSYYGARTIGIVGHDDPDFNIVLPKDCRGLMFDARHIENAGTFDAVNVTNFGAKSGSWREAFGFCPSLTRLYIKNLKVSLNISWSPIDYESISYIISAATNTNAITISVSSHTYNLLSQADFDLAASKNITIALLTGNYVEDRRLGEIANKADKSYVDTEIANLVNAAPETLDTIGELATAFGENKAVVDALNESIVNKQNKNVIVYRDSTTKKASMTAPEVMEKVRAGENVYYTTNLSGGTLHPYLEGADTGVFFYSNYIDNDRAIGTGILISADGTITNETYELEHLKDTVIHITSAERNRWNDTYTKTEVDNLFSAPIEYDAIILKSSTEGSSKKFRLTIGDDGVLSTEEII